MKWKFKQIYFLICVVSLLSSTAVAQEIPFLLRPNEVQVEKDVYVPPPPSEEDLRHYEMVAQANQKWSALFSDPNNPQLHLNVAKHYNLLGNGDIALHELGRAEELGIPRTDLLADIGRAYFLNERYDDIMNEIILGEALIDQHGEIYLLYGQVHYQRGNLQEAFLNFYQAEQFLEEDRFDLIAPLASLYSAMGDYEKAEEKVNIALNFKPKDADLLMLKGDLVHRRAGAEKSYKYYEWAHFYKPDDIQTEVKLAGALYNLNKRDEMVEVLRSILAKDQNHPFANYLIAANFAEGNNIRTARRYLNQAGNAYDNFAPALLLKGKLGYADGSYVEAEQSLKQLIRIEPDNLEGRRLLGASLLQQNKSNEAARVLAYLEEENRLEPTDYLLLGNAYILSGNQDKGTMYFSKIGSMSIDQISSDTRRKLNDFDSGHNHGVLLNINSLIIKNSSFNQMLMIEAFKALENKKYREAFDKAAAIIDQDRANPVGYNLLGLVYLAQGLSDEARSNFRRSLQIDRDFHQANLNLARLELAIGDRNAAINSLNQILSRDEKYVPAYEMLNQMALEDGDLISAERYLVTASNANPEGLLVREKLLNFYFDQNNLSKARALATRMADTFPDQAAPYKALGKVSLLEEEYETARLHLQKAIALDHTDSEIYVMLAQLLSQENKYEDSRSILQSGLYEAKNKLPLQLALIELAKQDGNFKNSHLYVDQLKLDEKTKASALLFEADLYLQQQRAEDAILSFEGAGKAGANPDLVADGIARANDLIANSIPLIELNEEEVQ
jgi:putative PEP-CTERM system TPR-repeat lipoprotein